MYTHNNLLTNFKHYQYAFCIKFGRSLLVSNLQTPTAHLYKCALGVWRFETSSLSQQNVENFSFYL